MDPKVRMGKLKVVRNLLAKFDVVAVQESHFDPDISGPLLAQFCARSHSQVFFRALTKQLGE